MADWFSDVEVFAAYCCGGQWSVVAPAVRELSGRHGIRRVARVSGTQTFGRARFEVIDDGAAGPTPAPGVINS
jgi:hypothetical protein